MITEFYKTVPAEEFSHYFSGGEIWLGHREVEGEYFPVIMPSKVTVRENCAYSPELVIKCSLPDVIEGQETIPLVRGMVEQAVERQIKSATQARDAEQKALEHIMLEQLEDMFEEFEQ